MSLKKDLNDVLKEARRQGFTTKLTKKSHHKIYAPTGELIATHGSTPTSVVCLT